MPKIFCRHRRLILAATPEGMTYRCARCFALRPHAWRGLSRRPPAKAEAMKPAASIGYRQADIARAIGRHHSTVQAALEE
jgi:hypothetical protein